MVRNAFKLREAALDRFKDLLLKPVSRKYLSLGEIPLAYEAIKRMGEGVIKDHEIANLAVLLLAKRDLSKAELAILRECCGDA